MGKPAAAGLYECAKCGGRFVSKSACEAHIIRNHVGEDPRMLCRSDGHTWQRFPNTGVEEFHCMVCGTIRYDHPDGSRSWEYPEDTDLAPDEPDVLLSDSELVNGLEEMAEELRQMKD